MVIQVFPRRLYFRPPVYLPPAHGILAFFSLFIRLFVSLTFVADLPPPPPFLAFTLEQGE